jgi:DNA-binding NarL/FixJ family response regulator
VILLDIKLPGLSGIDAIQHLKSRVPETHIIMLTIIDKPETIYAALRAGASGYLLKNSPLTQITAAVREASRGGMLMPSGVAEKVLSFFAQTHTTSDYRLTPREKEVLEQMVLGHSQKEIADQLFISSHTVNCHIQKIYDKLHVHSGVEAVSKALRERLIR